MRKTALDFPNQMAKGFLISAKLTEGRPPRKTKPAVGTRAPGGDSGHFGALGLPCASRPAGPGQLLRQGFKMQQEESGLDGRKNGPTKDEMTF